MILDKQALWISPTIFQPFQNLCAVQSTRNGGHSAPPYHSLNLGRYTKDDLGFIQKNQLLFFSKLGYLPEAVADTHQVHGNEILLVEKAGHYSGYDALITNKKDLLLSISVADCTPILIYDPKKEVIAAIHAGWKGTMGAIAEKTLTKMSQHFGSEPKDCFAYIGTCIDECSFEVDADVANFFKEDYKRWDEARGKFFIHLKKANKDQLCSTGIPPTQVEISPFDTVRDNDYFFSYRKEKGKTGRMLAAIGMKTGS